MTSTSSIAPWTDARSLAGLHACRSQDELEQQFAAGVAALMPGCDAALALTESDPAKRRVRFVLGSRCPLTPFDVVAADAWPLPESQRLAIGYGEHALGELLLGKEPTADVRAMLADAIVHFGTALVNLALNAEARHATDEYCATLQALEEGIILFQETDSDAVMARLLALASGMVGSTASALFVLEEVGNADSGLGLRQALGIPESLLEQFRGDDGTPWPDSLLDSPAQVIQRDADGAIAGLSADATPAVLQSIVVLPLRYHGVVAGVCLLFNPKADAQQTRDEIGRLQSFGQLAAALLHRLNLERLKEDSVSIERELEIAETIQKRLVPTDSPPNDDYEFAWHTIAAKNIGGDYVDVIESDLGDLYAVVADASGHGINSALLMTSFRANYRSNAIWLEPPEQGATLNTSVAHEVGPTGMFITAALVRIEQESGRLALCSAGHNPTMIYRAAAGEVEQVDSHGPPLGFLQGMEYDGYESDLHAGDVVLLYTDGITEATDAHDEMFGEDRLEALLLRHAAGSAQDVLDAALAELESFTGRKDHDDDVSLMVVKVKRS